MGGQRSPMAKLPVASIRTDGGTQPRMVMDHDAIEGYMDDMLSGVKFPPVIVFYDGTSYWLADGFHRRQAAFGAELTEIECDVRQGTLEDAQWFSFSANKSNGLRRSNEDKQRSVESALRHPRASGMSLRDIANHVGVSHESVRLYRERMKPICQTLTDSGRTVTRNGSTYQQNTANIGRKPEPARQAPVAVAPTSPPAAHHPERQESQPAPMRRDLVGEATHLVFSSLTDAVKLAEALAAKGEEAAGVNLLESIHGSVTAAIEKAQRATTVQ